MNIIKNIFTASTVARIGGSAQNGVIAETEAGKFYCLFAMSAMHGFKQIADGYQSDIGRSIESFSKSDKVFEVEKKISRKGREFFQAVENQY